MVIQSNEPTPNISSTTYWQPGISLSLGLLRRNMAKVYFQGCCEDLIGWSVWTCLAWCLPQSRCLRKIISLSFHCTASLVSSPLNKAKLADILPRVPRCPNSQSSPGMWRPEMFSRGLGRPCPLREIKLCNLRSVAHCWHSCTQPGWGLACSHEVFIWDSVSINDSTGKAASTTPPPWPTRYGKQLCL